MPIGQDERRRLWLGGSLLALAAVAVIGERSLRAPQRLSAAPGATPVAALEPLVPYLAVDSFRPAHELAPAPTPSVSRDPFRENVVAPRVVAHVRRPAEERPVQQQESITVSAILISDSRRAAVINDVLVNVGGVLPGGGRLTAVERDHVEVTDARGARRTININSGAL